MQGVLAHPWNYDSQNSFPCIVSSSCGPQKIFGVTSKSWKEAVAICFYTGKFHARHHHHWLTWWLPCLTGSQPALLNATALLRVPLKPGLVCAAPTAATAFAPSTHVRSPPSVSLTPGPAPRVWLQGDDHQPHAQVTSSEDAEPWWWVPARPAPHQLYHLS